MSYSTVIFEFLFCIIDTLLITRFFDGVFSRKYNSSIVFSGIIALISFLMYALSNLIEVNTIIAHLLLLVSYCLAMYNGKYYALVTYTIIFYFVYGFVVLFMLSCISGLFELNHSLIIADVYLYRVLFSLISKTLIYFGLVVIIRKKIKESYLLCFKQTTFGIIVVTMFMLVYLFYGLIFSNDHVLAKDVIFFLGIMIMVILISVAKVFKMYFDGKLETENYKHELESNEQRNQLYLKRAKNNLDIMLIKHDLKNILHSIDYNLEKGNVLGARKVIKNLYTRKSLMSSINSGNSMLDALLEIKVSDNQDIKFNINTSIDKFEIDSIDLSRLLGNALDNAIEATLYCQNKEIEITINEKKNIIYICIENPYKHDPKFGNKGILSFKRNNKEQGFGMISMEGIVEKYNGDLKYSFDHNIAKVEIYLSLK